MRETSNLGRVTAAVLFALLLAFPLRLGGLLGGDCSWSHYRPQASDPDETGAYFCGLVVGGFVAVGGSVAILWKFWPRVSLQLSQAGDKDSIA